MRGVVCGEQVWGRGGGGEGWGGRGGGGGGGGEGGRGGGEEVSVQNRVKKDLRKRVSD